MIDTAIKNNKIISKVNSLEKQYARSVGYTGNEELLYTSSNQDIQYWTQHFQAEVANKVIIYIYNGLTEPNLTRAIAVGVQWYRFSEYVPSWLCLAASKVSSNEKRHYVIQTAFEELGMRRVEDIHCEMFKAAAKSCGVRNSHFETYSNYQRISYDLDFLDRLMRNAKNDNVILGMLLELEAPAVENIDTVFNGLLTPESNVSELAKNEFFRIHRAVEEEHVRLTISNFLRFCTDEHAKEEFMSGFNDCLEFWKRFWNSVAHLDSKLQRENLVCKV